MQNRIEHTIEKVLAEKIKQKNEDAALVLVDLVYADREGARLDRVDEDENSFLHLALENDLHRAAEKILMLHLKDAKIISDVNGFLLPNKKGDTPLVIAITRRHSNMVELLLEYITSLKENIEHELYTKEDGQGNSLLHLIAKNQENDVKHSAERLRIIKLLLDYFFERKTVESKINSINKQGNTPLYLACDTAFYDVHVISLLMQNNACLTLENDEHKTPLSLLLQFPESDKAQLIISFYTYSSLQKGLIVKAELEGIDISMLSEINFFKFKNADLKAVLLKQDRDTLNRFYDIAEARLAELNTQQDIKYSAILKKIIFSITSMFIAIAIYVSLLTWLGVTADKLKDKDIDYFIGAILFSTLGAILPIAAGFLTCFISFKDTYSQILNEQWKDVQDILETLIDQMHQLESSVVLAVDYKATIKRFEDHLDHLNYPSKNIIDVKREITDLKSSIEDMKEVVRLTGTPFSLFAKPAAQNNDEDLEVIVLSESADEVEDVRLEMR